MLKHIISRPAPFAAAANKAHRTAHLARHAPLPAVAAKRALSDKVTSGATGVYPAAPSPLQEFSVVYTDRALNHMSEPFKKVMLDMKDILEEIGRLEAKIRASQNANASASSNDEGGDNETSAGK